MEITKREIIENDMLIDLWMAQFEEHESDRLNIINDLTVKGHAPRDYHEWNEIMPVVEKIDMIGASVIIGRMFCEIKYIDPLNQEKTFNVRIVSGVKINAINGAAIEFIEWYNENKS